MSISLFYKIGRLFSPLLPQNLLKGHFVVETPKFHILFVDVKACVSTRDLRSFEIRFEFESAVLIRLDSKVMGRFENFRIGRACPLFVVVKQLKPLMALSGIVYRFASSMSDHTLVLFNMFEEWNEKSVFLHISFV